MTLQDRRELLALHLLGLAFRAAGVLCRLGYLEAGVELVDRTLNVFIWLTGPEAGAELLLMLVTKVRWIDHLATREA